MVSLDRIGSVGALVAALAAPCCFPLFAAIGTAAGLGALGQYEGVILGLFQGSAVLTLAGLALSFRRHRDPAPLIVGALGCANLAYHFYWESSLPALYGGLFGLIAAAIWNYVSTRRGRQPTLQSTVICPHCGHKSDQTMPTNACVFFYDCPACNIRLKPRAGDWLRVLQLRVGFLPTDSDRRISLRLTGSRFQRADFGAPCLAPPVR